MANSITHHLGEYLRLRKIKDTYDASGIGELLQPKEFIAFEEFMADAIIQGMNDNKRYIEEKLLNNGKVIGELGLKEVRVTMAYINNSNHESTNSFIYHVGRAFNEIVKEYKRLDDRGVVVADVKLSEPS